MTTPAETAATGEETVTRPTTQPSDISRTLRTFRPQLLAVIVAVLAAIVDQYGLVGGARLSATAWSAILAVVLAGAVATAARTIHARTASPETGSGAVDDGAVDSGSRQETDTGNGASTGSVAGDADVAASGPVLQPLRRDLVALLARNRIRVQHTYGGDEPYSLALRGGRAAVVVCAECDGADPHASAAVRRIAELVVARPEMADAPIVIVYTDRGKFGPARDGNLILASSATALRAVQQATSTG